MGLTQALPLTVSLDLMQCPPRFEYMLGLAGASAFYTSFLRLLIRACRQKTSLLCKIMSFETLTPPLSGFHKKDFILGQY